MRSRAIEQKYPITKERLARVRAMKDSDIDFSDIPETTDEEIARATRRGRPIKALKKQAISLRLPIVALNKLRASGKGWQTRLSAKIAQLVSKGLL
jgi:uncharacterized protein (DUF4415 family)